MEGTQFIEGFSMKKFSSSESWSFRKVSITLSNLPGLPILCRVQGILFSPMLFDIFDLVMFSGWITFGSVVCQTFFEITHATIYR